MALLSVLLGDGIWSSPHETTLTSFGLDEYGVGELWDVVREEFAERAPGPVDGADELDPTMTIGVAAASMARLLTDRHALGRTDLE
jgi:hypothetical protein